MAAISLHRPGALKTLNEAAVKLRRIRESAAGTVTAAET
jgi:hypothetical protein